MTRPGGGDRGVHLDLHAMSDMRRRSRLLWSPTPPLHTATRSRSRTRAGTRGRAQRTRVQRGLPRLVHRPPSHQHTSTTPPPLRLGGRTERERAVDATREYTASHSSDHAASTRPYRSVANLAVPLPAAKAAPKPSRNNISSGDRTRMEPVITDLINSFFLGARAPISDIFDI